MIPPLLPCQLITQSTQIWLFGGPTATYWKSKTDPANPSSGGIDISNRKAPWIVEARRIRDYRQDR